MTHRALVFCLIFFFLSKAKAQQYLIDNYGVTEGLGQSEVYAITEDSLGYLWLGTRGGGVSKFDGKTFENFTKKEGLKSNFVQSLVPPKL